MDDYLLEKKLKDSCTPLLQRVTDSVAEYIALFPLVFKIAAGKAAKGENHI